MNPARMFGPALLSGEWDRFHLYFFGQMIGAVLAGVMVHNLHKLGLTLPSKRKRKVDVVNLSDSPMHHYHPVESQ